MILYQEGGGEVSGGSTEVDPVTSAVDDVTSGCFGSIVLLLIILGEVFGTLTISFLAH